MDILKLKDINFTSNINFTMAKLNSIIPENAYITKNYPTYLYHEDRLFLVDKIRKNSVIVYKNKSFFIKSIRNIKKGDKIVAGKLEDGSEGIYLDLDIFKNEKKLDMFSFDSNINASYDKLVDKLIYEKENNGYIIWVLGPSVVFDYDTRLALERLVEKGYINCIFAGNAMATHDLEAGYLNTALGQNIYTQENVTNGHYNHLDLINEVRDTGSIENFVSSKKVKNGLMKKIVEKDIPYVLAGSIRDDGPLPGVYSDTNNVLDKKEEYLEKATLVIGLATMLHNGSTLSIMPTYRISKGEIKPIHFYAVDITTSVLIQLSNVRDNLFFNPFITNVQDFVVNISKLIDQKEETYGY